MAEKKTEHFVLSENGFLSLWIGDRGDDVLKMKVLSDDYLYLHPQKVIDLVKYFQAWLKREGHDVDNA